MRYLSGKEVINSELMEDDIERAYLDESIKEEFEKRVKYSRNEDEEGTRSADDVEDLITL